MKHRILKKIAGILTAAALCFPIINPYDSSANSDDLTKFLLEQELDCSSFTYLAWLVLNEYVSQRAGNSLTLSEQQKTILDVDSSEFLDTGDAYLFLSWSTICGAFGVLPQDAEIFLNQWNASVVGTSTTPAETTEIPTETTEFSTIATTSATPMMTETSTASTTTTSTISTATETISATTIVSATSDTTEAITTSTILTTAFPAITSVTSTIESTPSVGDAWENKEYYNGIDVSKYQGNIDWEAVRNDGVDFAIIRAGYGKFASQEDPYFDQNMRNAKAAGIACGAYWFSYAESPSEAVQEAEVFAQVIEGYQFEYPLVFDIEAPQHTQMSKEEISAIITAFCTTMEEKGYYVSVYSYAYFLNNYIYQSVLEKYDIWVAHFNTDKPSYSKSPYGMWQYSDTGSIKGINANVDLDYSYRCYPNIMIQHGLNGYS